MPRKRLFILILLIGTPTLLFLLAELGIRTLKWLQNRPSIYVHHEHIGWAPNLDIERSFQKNSIDGSSHAVLYSTDAKGFRYSEMDWSRAHAETQPILLVLGDSYIGDPDVSDDKLLCAHLERKLPMRVYGYGVGGIGTWQQSLLLEELLLELEPRVFLLQVSENDLGNNDIDAPIQQQVRSQGWRRPYPSANGESLRIEGFAANLYRFGFRYSKVFALLDTLLSRAQQETIQICGAEGSAELERQHKLMQQSLQRIRSQLPEDCRCLLFSTDMSDANRQWLAQAAEAVGFHYLESVQQAVDTAEAGGQVVRMADGMHWNERGHAIAAESILSNLPTD